MAGLAVLAALGGGAAVAATGFGDGSSRGPDATPTILTAQQVRAPSATTGKRVVSKSAGTKLIYKETKPRTVASTSGRAFLIGKCPEHSGAINGYYLPNMGNFGVTPAGGGPTPNARKWELDVVAQPASSQVIFGIVCLKP